MSASLQGERDERCHSHDTSANDRGGAMLASQLSIVYGITAGVSAKALLKGQLSWMSRREQITLVCDPDENSRSAAEREGVRLVGIPMRRNPSPIADLRSLWQWNRRLRELSPSVTNVSTPKAAILGGIAARLNRVPRRFYVVRGLRLEGAKGLPRHLLWFMERLTIAMATDIIFVSPSLAIKARNLKLVGKKNAWLIGQGSSNGVDARAIGKTIAETNRNESRGALGIAPSSFVVGFVGRLTGDKGIDTLVSAMQSSRLHDRVLLVAVGILEETRLKQLLESLASRVRLLPPTNDVASVMAGMDVLCLPTLREGFPNVVLEAAVVGIPAITTRATGAVDSIIDGETGFLIDVDDVAALVDRINELADDPELVSQMGHAAHERAVKDFQPERIWEGLLSIMRGEANADVHRV